jgi:hypothetical protein
LTFNLVFYAGDQKKLPITFGIHRFSFIEKIAAIVFVMFILMDIPLKGVEEGENRK